MNGAVDEGLPTESRRQGFAKGGLDLEIREEGGADFLLSGSLAKIPLGALVRGWSWLSGGGRLLGHVALSAHEKNILWGTARGQ